MKREKKVFGVVNQKGGVGKTAVSVNLSAAIAMADANTLLVDCDSQANATSGLGINPEKTIYEALLELDKVSPEEFIYSTKVDRLKIIPSKRDLAGAEIELVGQDNREKKLKKVLERVKENFEFIFIDCPPSLGLLTVNSLFASDYIIIPIVCEYYPLEGIAYLMKTIELVKSSKSDIEIFGVIVNMFDPRPLLYQEVLSEINKYFGSKVFNTKIPRNVKIAEAPSYGKSVIEYEPRSKGAQAFVELAREFLERVKKL